MQLEAPATLNVPISHCLHLCWPTSSWYSPGEQMSEHKHVDALEHFDVLVSELKTRESSVLTKHPGGLSTDVINVATFPPAVEQSSKDVIHSHDPG